MRRILGIAAAAALASVSTAEAATFSFMNGSGVSAVPGGYQKTVDGITLTVTAGLYTSSGVVYEGYAGARPWLYSGYGLGAGYSGDGQHTVDGRGAREVVIFSFDQDVIFEQIRFNYVGYGSGFDFFADEGGDDSLDRVFQSISIPNVGTYVIASIFSEAGSLFGIGAGSKWDSFKIKSITVSAMPEVPLPAALPLFLAGLAGLRFAGRRKRRTAQAG